MEQKYTNHINCWPFYFIYLYILKRCISNQAKIWFFIFFNFICLFCRIAHELVDVSSFGYLKWFEAIKCKKNEYYSLTFIPSFPPEFRLQILTPDNSWYHFNIRIQNKKKWQHKNANNDNFFFISLD